MATIYGTAGNDTRQGTAAADTMWGRAGHDHLLGQGGNDTVRGEAGDDKLDGGAGNDRLEGGIGVDFLGGGVGNDLGFGQDGNDYLWDLIGVNTMDGGAGNDRLVGNKDSHMLGGIGDDALVLDFDGLVAGNGTGRAAGAEGRDTLVVNVDDASMRDGAENPTGIVDQPFARIEVTGLGAGGLSGTAGLQNEIVNDDFRERIGTTSFDGINAFESSPDSQLHYSGRRGEGGPTSETVSIKGGIGQDLFELGHDNEVVTTGRGMDTILIGGIGGGGANGRIDYGVDRVLDFNQAEGDMLMFSYGGDGSRVDVQETATQTIFRSFVDGQSEPVNTTVVDVVGIDQNHVWYDYYPV